MTGKFYDVNSLYPPIHTFTQKCSICGHIALPLQLAIHIHDEHYTKENTMNTYTVYINNVTGTTVSGTDANTNDGRLNILDGDKLVAVFNIWEHYSVERNVDKGYIDKINALDKANEELAKALKASSERENAEYRETSRLAEKARNLEKRAERAEEKVKEQRLIITDKIQAINNLKMQLNAAFDKNVGTCTERYRNIMSDANTLGCELPHGHQGMHHDPSGADWHRI